MRDYGSSEALGDKGGHLYEQCVTNNEQAKPVEWMRRITECRNSRMRIWNWCSVNHLCPQTYYRWQGRLFELAHPQQTPQFAAVIPRHSVSDNDIAVIVRMIGAEAEIRNGVDITTVEQCCGYSSHAERLRWC